MDASSTTHFSKNIKRFASNATLFLFMLAAVIALTVKVVPGAEMILFSEDGIIEDLSAVAYAFAALVGMLAIHHGVLRHRSWQEKVALVTIPLLGAICALDEISWGARHFHLEMPKMQGGGEFDGVHDVFIMIERALIALDPVMRAVIFIAAAVFFLAVTCWKRKSIVNYLYWLAEDAVRRCLGLTILLLAVAVFLDFGHGRIISSLEEFSELSASFFLARAGLNALRARGGGRLWRSQESATF